LNTGPFFQRVLVLAKLFFLCLFLFVLEIYISSVGTFLEFKPSSLLVLLILLILREEFLVATLVSFVFLLLFASFTASNYFFLSLPVPILALLKTKLKKKEKDYSGEELYKDLLFLFLTCFLIELINFVYFVLYKRSTELILGLKILLVSPLISVLIGLFLIFLLKSIINSKKKEIVEF